MNSSAIHTLILDRESNDFIISTNHLYNQFALKPNVNEHGPLVSFFVYHNLHTLGLPQIISQINIRSVCKRIFGMVQNSGKLVSH